LQLPQSQKKALTGSKLELDGNKVAAENGKN